jgi:hypothetical protein
LAEPVKIPKGRHYAIVVRRNVPLYSGSPNLSGVCAGIVSVPACEEVWEYIPYGVEKAGEWRSDIESAAKRGQVFHALVVDPAKVTVEVTIEEPSAGAGVKQMGV